MQKWTITFLSLVLCTASTTALAQSSLDDMLVEKALVDDDYRYTDLTAVDAFYQRVNTISQRVLPRFIGEGLQIRSMTYSSAGLTLSAIAFKPLKESEIAKLKDKSLIDSLQKKLCLARFLPSKTMMANDTEISLHLTYLNDYSIDLTANAEICQPYQGMTADAQADSSINFNF